MNATYRLQLTPGFRFEEVRQLLPYWRRLGVTHLYLSPISESRKHSTHGYDVTDHNQVREALGGADGFESLRQAAVDAGLELILDFVPNHAGVGPGNQSWQDVLSYGPHSPFTSMFDIDWAPLKQELKEKLLLPFLGQPYGRVLDGGEVKLVCQGGRLWAGYFNQRFALRPESYADVLEELLPRIERTDAYWTVKELVDAYRSVLAGERERAEALHERFAALPDEVVGPLEEALAAFEGQRLHALLEQQFWRLSYFKAAGYEINYRRFFDINELVGLRMEDPEVFFSAHRQLGQLCLQEGISGVRIDHIDGLSDPHSYLERLREIGARHIWVEKILAPGEILPDAWPVEGTTGYEFLNDVLRLLNWPGGRIRLEREFRRVVDDTPYVDVVNESKQLVMATTLAGELFRLAYSLDRLSEADYHTRDFTLEAMREALGQVVAAFGCYRTYIPHESERAKDVIKAAIHEAKQRSPAFENSVYDFIEDVLLGRIAAELEDTRMAWVARFQQYCAPVAAKGVEDTAFYRFAPLLALNEVGGEPDHFAQEPQAIHAHARFRALRYPRNLLATATHDHKRGEDTRMRMLALSQLGNDWHKLMRQLERARRRHKGERGPDSSDAYIFYQTLVALWKTASLADLTERIAAYMVKASREAKRSTNWINPDLAYEADLDRFVRGMMNDRWVGRAVTPLAAQLAHHGFFNSITQLILKLTSPGVPDIYQGCEIFDHSLVDPDNRHPVDYALREEMLDQLEPMLAQPDPAGLRVLIDTLDPKFKFYVTACLLRFRGQMAAPFAGGYQSLALEGQAEDFAFAYAREGGGQTVAVIVPRFSLILQNRGGVGDTRVILPQAGPWREVLTGNTFEVQDDSGTLAVAALPLPWAVLYAATRVDDAGGATGSLGTLGASDSS